MTTTTPVDLTDEEHLKNVRWYEARHSELLDQYPNQWVAILDQRVVGVADDGFELIAQLRDKGIPPHLPLRRELSTNPKLLIVPVL